MEDPTRVLVSTTHQEQKKTHCAALHSVWLPPCTLLLSQHIQGEFDAHAARISMTLACCDQILKELCSGEDARICPTVRNPTSERDARAHILTARVSNNISGVFGSPRGFTEWPRHNARICQTLNSLYASQQRMHLHVDLGVLRPRCRKRARFPSYAHIGPSWGFAP